jgi:lysophospholipase L1-like esterase
MVAAPAGVWAQAPLKHIKVVLVGDSTVATEGGWGPGFCARLRAEVECVDLAANGRSTRSFVNEGRWAKALEEKGQFYFIQFGHNDQKTPPTVHTDPETTFAEYLRRYIADVRAVGGTPVLVTSLSRRNYKDGKLLIDPLRDYAAATRRVADEEHVPLVDLYQRSTTLLEGMTQEEADRFDASTHADAKAEGANAAKPDRTHLNDLGKETFGEMVAELVKDAVPGLKPYVETWQPKK